MYQVLARKWRPRTFDELIGQEHVGKTLTNAIAQDRLAHAYIFSGLRGTGKTSAARILARALNCERGPTPEPCNECTPCREILENRALDVMEMDAASRTGVDDIRELQEVINYPPVRDRYKLLIIDEVHMLSKSASNALLKTLEEPPARVVFVLATTEIQRLLPTILSRCQVFEFRRVLPRELTAHLARLCGEEKIDISETSLERIARAGEGSVRDSLTHLERILAFCGQEVGDDDVLRVLGAVRFDMLQRMIGGVAERDAATMLSVLDELMHEGHDLLFFWSELIGVVRDVMLRRAAPEGDAILSRSEAEIAALTDATSGLTTEDLNRVFRILADLEPGLKASGQPRYLFEAALIRLASLGSVRPIEEILARLGGAASPQTAAPRGKRAPARAPAQKKNEADRGASTGLTPAPVAAAPPNEAATLAPGGGLAATLGAAVEGRRPMVAAMLAHAASIRHRDGRLLLGFTRDQRLIRQQLEREDNLEAVRSCAAELLGDENIRCEFEDDEPELGAAEPAQTPPRPDPPGEEARAPSNPAPVELTLDDRSAAPRPARPDRKQMMSRARKDPAVKSLLREFGAQIVEIGPLQGSPAADSPLEEGS